MQILYSALQLFHYLSDLKQRKRDRVLKKYEEALPKIIFQNAAWEKDVVIVHYFEKGAAKKT